MQTPRVWDLLAVFGRPGWESACQLVMDNDICTTDLGGVNHGWIGNNALAKANVILLRYKYATGKTQWHPHAFPDEINVVLAGFVVATAEISKAGKLGNMYIDVICSRKPFSGRPLLERALQLARGWNFKTVSLSALPHVIDYYTRFGFRSGEDDPCDPEWQQGRSGSKKHGYKFRKCLLNRVNYYNSRANIPRNAVLNGGVSNNENVKPKPKPRGAMQAIGNLASYWLGGASQTSGSGVALNLSGRNRVAKR